MTEAQDNHDRVDNALAQLAQLAVSVLANEMRSAKTSKERIAAANSILDRTGYSRTTRAMAEVADDEIRRALEAIEGTKDEAKKPMSLKEIEALVPDDEDEAQEQEQDQEESPELGDEEAGDTLGD